MKGSGLWRAHVASSSSAGIVRPAPGRRHYAAGEMRVLVGLTNVTCTRGFSEHGILAQHSAAFRHLADGHRKRSRPESLLRRGRFRQSLSGLNSWRPTSCSSLVGPANSATQNFSAWRRPASARVFIGHQARGVWPEVRAAVRQRHGGGGGGGTYPASSLTDRSRLRNEGDVHHSAFCDYYEVLPSPCLLLGNRVARAYLSASVPSSLLQLSQVARRRTRFSVITHLCESLTHTWSF